MKVVFHYKALIGPDKRHKQVTQILTLSPLSQPQIKALKHQKQNFKILKECKGEQLSDLRSRRIHNIQIKRNFCNIETFDYFI